MTDGKYVVFNRDEFIDYIQGMIAERIELEELNPIADAVVIRLQDVFASAALYCYASSITIAVNILRSGGATERADELSKVADYFA